MKRLHCISCGQGIMKSSPEDAYVCRECDTEHGFDLDQYLWLDAS